jgi:hypothetical protein
VVLRAGKVAQPAVALIERVKHPGDMTPRYSIRWEAEGGGTYPEFDGELIVQADQDYNGFWLILTGAYVPPGGLAGRAFDATVGRRIASSTVRDLLREIRVDIEARFRAQEQSKAS